ncbi:MAG: sugar transferase [Candidatus Pacebacteria bacterium]|nr:sugar transferase [Candidatus Paceibacterota bacterium]
MTFGGKKATALLFGGDVIVFIFSLWLTLLVRYVALPDQDLFLDHIQAFWPLFCIWLLVFYIAGLYGKRVILFKSELWGALLRTQLINIIIAALYFFFIPNIGIAPKTNLILYLFISLALICLWRIGAFPRMTRPSVRDRAALIGSGPEIEELLNEVNGNPRYHVQLVIHFTPERLATDFSTCVAELSRENVSMLVVDTQNDLLRPLLSRVYELAFVSPTYQLVDFYEMYEEIFDRVPLSLLQYEWFLRNVSTGASNFYEVGKRIIDLIGGVAMGLVTIVAIPFVYLALRAEGSGPLFITQDRLGRNGTHIKTYKFRSMRYVDDGAWKGEGDNYVTRVGAFLRTTSLDEFPQYINILRGELSLIGPRNDILGLANRLSDAIPYYSIRYIVKPGITGWAQINQQYEPGNISPQSLEETKMRLAYDFYYIKHRSFALDVVIALKTMKRMFFRVSSL